MEDSGGGQSGNVTEIRRQPSHSISLTIQQGADAGQRYVLNKDDVTIGRLSSNDVQVNDSEVSRHHANIHWENGQFFIRDLGSSNGTTVNGRLITGTVPLRNGDVIGMGNTIFAFEGTGVIPESNATVARSKPAAPTMPATTPPLPKRKSRVSTTLIVGAVTATVLALVLIAALFFLLSRQAQAGPDVRVQEPASGSQVEIGKPVTVLASAHDRKGISRLEFRVNGVLNATIASSVPGGQPDLIVQQVWTPTEPGFHNLSLQAFNSDGDTGKPVEILVNVTGESVAQASTLTPTTQGTATPTATSEGGAAACTNNAAFVADVTVPDNSIFNPGDRIDKTWRIRNTGTCPWQAGYQLVFVSGDKMGAPDSQAVVPTSPGGTADVTVTMYAPGSPGVYQGVWRMVTNQGQVFGPNFTILIQVKSPSVTATHTATSSALPAPLVELTVDDANINGGECTTVRATVQNVAAAWLDGEPVVGGYKEKNVCPCGNTTYTLDAVKSSGEHIYRSVTVVVTGVCPGEQPDLTILALEADDDTPEVGTVVNMKMRIKNQGATPATNFAVAWRPFGASSTTWIIVADSQILNPGQDKWINWTYTYESWSTYESKGVVDYLNNVPESNEGNNEKTLTMQPHPAIVVPGFSFTLIPPIFTLIPLPTPTPTFGFIFPFPTLIIPGP